MAPTPDEFTAPTEVTKDDFGEKIVISGMAGQYASARHVKDLSNILYNKVNPVTDNHSRWQYNHPEVSQFTGKLPGLAEFDAQFFKVHYRLGNNTDPMSRKLMEQSYQAIYDSGISPEELFGRKVGVYIGSCLAESDKCFLYVASSKNGLGISGCSKTMFANRISYWLNAKGPSISIAQSCCSASVALEQAYQAIKRGECEAAIVGGANLCLHPQSSIHYARIMTLSTNNETKSYDTNAAGCTKSEAVNVLFLQKAKHALRIYAEIVHVKSEFTSLLQGESGPRYGFYRDTMSMVKFLEQFYEEAKVSPQQVEYVEGFGSAVPEADKTELEAIEEVFCKSRRDPLLVGSVTSNIGYSEAASGISSITKVLLGYQNRKLAGNLNCDSPRQDISSLRDGRMKIITDHQSFKGSYTAVNGLSITGVNAHVLLNGLYKPKDLSRYKSTIPHLVTISSRQDSSLPTILNDLKSKPIDPEELALLHNIHKSRITGHLGRGFIILDTDENNKTVSLCEKVNYYDDVKRPLWFVYSGMGSQWSGMGAQLMRIPIFAAAIERCHKVLEPKGVDIVHIITSPDKKIFDNILNSFVGIAAIQIGLTDILRELDIFPDKIIGHSVGELGCAYADGCFTAEDMILAAYSRGLVSVQTPFIRGSMAAVGIGYQQISKICPPEIEVACHNGPDSSTISGPADIMKEFVEQLTKRNIFAKEVPCSNIAYHSRYIAEAGPGLLKYLKEVIPSPKLRSKRWVSTSVPQSEWDEPDAKYSSAEYHTNNLLNSVLFEETSRLIPNNAVVVEIAPHGLLQAILKRSLPDTCKHIPLTRRGHPDNAIFLLEAIGNLYMEGYDPKIYALYPKVEFPVSTGTPMLSHLVEWAHTEKWFISLYKFAHRKTAASCKHTLSIHDDEHSYLRGHIIGGNILYPFSGILIAVWDVLSMIMNVEKKRTPVQFEDVHIHSYEILNENKHLKSHITIQRGTGRFEVFNDNRLIMTGFISSNVNEVNISDDESKDQSDDILYSNDIYQLLNARGFNYTDSFRTIKNVNHSLTKGQITWSDNWITFIEGLIQMNLLRKSGDSMSYPNYIKRIIIDPNQHAQSETVDVDGFSSKTAVISEVHDWSRAGGLIIEHIQFQDLSSTQANEIALKTLTFIPHFTIDKINEESALYAFLQLAAENLNKETINIIEISDTNSSQHIEKIKNIADNITGLNVNVSYIYRDNILKQCNIFKTVDLLFINNLSIDDPMCQMLHQVLNRDTFIINKEVSLEMSNERPTGLYREISTHVIGNNRFELLSWRPSDISSSTSAFSVLSTSDLASLASSLPILPAKQRVIILSSYPPVPGLRNLINEWRIKDNRKINLVMINNQITEDQNLDQMSFSDLFVNILDHGIWGGEYFLPILNDSIESGEKALEIKELGDLDTLQWVKAPEPSNPGVTVTVNYAGINDVDVKTKLNNITHTHINSKKLIAFDFSGKTESGMPVMGVVQEESIRTKVKVRSELLWPVPEHWTLEDAATVPLAYVMAFYCLCIKTRLYAGNTILVHGGAGALGQAVISIALAHGCEVFTTVSDTKKKQFLCKVFPELKEDNIGSSRNLSFSDVVLNGTKGIGCNIVISCTKGSLKNASLKCCAPTGIVIDTSIILNHEDFKFGMNILFKALSYITLDLSSLFEPRNIDELKQIQYMMSEGIARGYVRPLTRVTYAPSEVRRAYRLLASSRHRGRVLLNLQKDIPCVQTKIMCGSDLYQLVVSNDEILGIELAERLVSRGARKLVLHFMKQSNCLLLKLRFWEKQGIEVKLSFGNDIPNQFPQNVEGIYYINVPKLVAEKINKSLESINSLKLQLSSPLKQFAIITTDNESGKEVPTSQEKILVTRVIIPELKTNENSENKSITPKAAVDFIEDALCSKKRIVLGHVSQKPSQSSFLKDITRIAGIEVPGDVSGEVTLRELGMNPLRTEAVKNLLLKNYDITFDESNILSLTIDNIRELEQKNEKYGHKNIKGLNSFYSYVDHDELLATTEIILLETLGSTSLMRECEFDPNKTYLCVVPGLEGHHNRFRTLCERLKVPALVLQLPINQTKRTIRELAERFVKILFKQKLVKDNFMLLGYEKGVLLTLEMASILESYGFTGTVFCLGGTPEEIQLKFEQELIQFKTEEELQEELLRLMLKLIIKKTPDNLKTIVQNNLTFEENVSNCIKLLGDSIPISNEYAREIIQTAYSNILEMRRYVSDPKPLRSLVIYMRPRDISRTGKEQQYSQQPVIEYELQSILAHAAEDLACSAIVNRHLGEDVIKNFYKQNILDTYDIPDDSCLTTADHLEI